VAWVGFLAWGACGVWEPNKLPKSGKKADINLPRPPREICETRTKWSGFRTEKVARDANWRVEEFGRPENPPAG
jgi:hypothetical protein